MQTISVGRRGCSWWAKPIPGSTSARERWWLGRGGSLLQRQLDCACFLHTGDRYLDATAGSMPGLPRGPSQRSTGEKEGLQASIFAHLPEPQEREKVVIAAAPITDIQPPPKTGKRCCCECTSRTHFAMENIAWHFPRSSIANVGICSRGVGSI